MARLQVTAGLLVLVFIAAVNAAPQYGGSYSQASAQAASSGGPRQHGLPAFGQPSFGSNGYGGNFGGRGYGGPRPRYNPPAYGPGYGKQGGQNSVLSISSAKSVSIGGGGFSSASSSSIARGK